MTERPIFVLGIQRGGTNQILNILRSHPDTFWPQGEFHEVFRPRGLRREGARQVLAKWARYAPIRLRHGDILDPDRRPEGTGLLAGGAGRALRAGLAASARANGTAVKGYKEALQARGFLDAGVAPERMLVKVMNYNLAFARDLLALWPEARLVGVIRDGRAVCEGHVARGAGVAAAAAVYAFVGETLAALEAEGLPVRTWRFEDLLADAAGVARDIYGFCGLDPARVRGVCLQDKARVTGPDGRTGGNRKVDLYYGLDEIGRHMRADANAGALARLPDGARAEVEARAETALRRFGYV